MNILICDDEKEICEQFKSIILKKYPDWTIYIAESSENIRHIFNEFNSKFDVVFMDIVLEEESGIDIANKFSEQFLESRLIFISGYPDKVPGIFFKAEPFGFINKPLNAELIYRYIDKALRESEMENRYFSCNKAGKELRIPFSNILYIESMGRKLFIKTENGEFNAFGKIDEIKNAPDSFVRCHKSFLVNMNFVDSYSKHCFFMKDKKEINVSRSRLTEAESKYYIFRGGIA